MFGIGLQLSLGKSVTPSWMCWPDKKRRGLASSGKDSETDMNWIDRFNFATASLGRLYFISLHWALTLFIGTMEVAWLARSLRVDGFARLVP